MPGGPAPLLLGQQTRPPLPLGCPLTPPVPGELSSLPSLPSRTATSILLPPFCWWQGGRVPPPHPPPRTPPPVFQSFSSLPQGQMPHPPAGSEFQVAFEVRRESLRTKQPSKHGQQSSKCGLAGGGTALLFAGGPAHTAAGHPESVFGDQGQKLPLFFFLKILFIYS